MKKILFARCNVNEIVGMCHIKRLTEVCDLLKKNYKIIFLIDKKNHITEKINNFEKIYLYKDKEKFSHKLEIKKTKTLIKKIKPDLLLIDDYRINHIIEKKINNFVKLVILDDLANRKHYCDVLIDFGWYGTKTYSRYKNLLNSNCKLLLGPKYFPLTRLKSKKKFIKKKSIEITLYFGGGNFPENISGLINRINKECRRVFNDRNFNLNLVVGNFNKNFSNFNLKKNIIIHKPNKNLNQLFDQSDIFFSAVNSAIYKIASINKSSNTFLIFLNKNQYLIKNYLNDFGYKYFFSLKNCNSIQINSFLKELKFRKFVSSDNSKLVIDNQGSKRIYDFIMQEFNDSEKFKLVDDSMTKKYLEMRNQINNRKFSLNSKKILFKNHIYWWHNSINITKYFYLKNNKIIFYFFLEKLKKTNNIGFITLKKINIIDLIPAYNYLISMSKNIIGHVNKKNKLFIYLNRQFNFKIIKKIKSKNREFYLMKK